MLFLATLCLLASAGYVLGECKEGCKEPTLLYDGLNCKPIFASPGDCCPSKYDCSHIEARAAAKEEICHFRGKKYKSGEAIDDNEILGNCQVGCNCRKKNSGNMGFNCAVLDCPEWLHRKPRPGCHFKYELDKCCGGAEVCAPFATTCEVAGKTYHEGNTFDAPDKKCTKCVCESGFSGKFEAPFCKKKSCIDEVRRQVEVNTFCAPTFITLDDCCPHNWKCPEKEDKIVPAAKPSELKCKYGEQSLNIGDKFERTSGEKGKLSCECKIPPYMTCIQNYDYPSFAPEY